jgi:acyl-CoA synthetase (AMP-forming)/AMP-acid ligase II
MGLRTPNLMDGHLDAPDASALALRDGWYHTGNLGVLDRMPECPVDAPMLEILETGFVRGCRKLSIRVP